MHKVYFELGCLRLSDSVLLFSYGYGYVLNTKAHYYCIDKHDGIDRISKYKLIDGIMYNVSYPFNAPAGA
jgi:hypothetical protein